MNIEILKNDLRTHEGFSTTVYKDTLGYKTVGIGHLIKETDPRWLRDLEPGDKITREDALDLFEKDLSIAIHDTESIFDEYWDELPSEAQEVFVNMVFNLGKYRFSRFKKTIIYAYKKDWEKCADEMLDSLWAKQVGRRSYLLSEKIRRLAK